MCTRRDHVFLVCVCEARSTETHLSCNSGSACFKTSAFPCIALVPRYAAVSAYMIFVQNQSVYKSKWFPLATYTCCLASLVLLIGKDETGCSVFGLYWQPWRSWTLSSRLWRDFSPGWTPRLVIFPLEPTLPLPRGGFPAGC